MSRGLTADEAVKIIERDFMDNKGRIHNKRVNKPAPSGDFYVWKTAGDDKVRSHHAAREGKIFRSDKPHNGIHPGHEYGCRCQAVPIEGEDNEILKKLKEYWDAGKNSEAGELIALVVAGVAGASVLKDYFAMRHAWLRGADKYFHCLANCRTTKINKQGEKVAREYSDWREITDAWRKGKNPEDEAADQAANRHGREGALKYPDKSCREICEDLRPKALKPKWWY